MKARVITPRAMWRKDGETSVSSETVFSFDIFSRPKLERAFRACRSWCQTYRHFPKRKQHASLQGANCSLFSLHRADDRPAGFAAVGRDEAGEWDENTVEILRELAEYMLSGFQKPAGVSRHAGSRPRQRAGRERAHDRAADINS